MSNKENNLIPMLSVTGRPTKDEIYRSIEQFHKVGINNIMLYPRDGLEIEYMGEEWLETVEHFLIRCEELNMHIWLYDEFNWPSGSCKNTVQKLSRKYWLKCMRLGEIDTADCDNIYNPEGDLIEIIAKRSHVNILNPDAVDAFIELTHEKYYAHFSKYFGNVIVGIFTDEPSYIYTANDFENCIPYYDDMEADYRCVCGRDMFEDAKKANIKTSGDFIKITNDLLGKKFREVYINKITTWCSKHGIESTGHFLGEERIAYNGNILPALKELSLPGIDDIFTRYDKFEMQAYGLIQYASEYRKQAMVELFALGPCNITYDKMKKTIWQAAVFGITHYFLAIAHMDIRGNYKKCKYFNACYDVQPNFEAMRLLSYVAEKAVEYSKMPHKREIAVRYPRSFSLLYGEKSFNDFINCIKVLSDMQIQWHIIDENDTASEKYVLSFECGITEENSGTKIENLTHWVNKNIQKSVYVCENGVLADNLILRVFENNHAVVINTSNKARELIIFDGNEKKAISLPIDGVFVYTGEPVFKAKEIIPFDADFSFEQCDYGFYRAQLTPSFRKDEIYVECETEVYVIARQYKTPCVIKLDDNVVSTDNPCSKLHYSIAPFYKMSDRIKLAPGKHTIEIMNDVPEKKYFPICWMCGDFSVLGNNILPKNKSDYYFGKGKYTAKVAVPDKEMLALYFETNVIYSKVYINGELISDVVFTPQIVNIPRKFAGCQVTLTIEQFTSVAPLFGNIKELNEKITDDTSKSYLTCNSVPEKCGIRNTQWLCNR